MDRERAKELLPFIQALAEGKTIQVFGADEEWHDNSAPDFFSQGRIFPYQT